MNELESILKCHFRFSVIRYRPKSHHRTALMDAFACSFCWYGVGGANRQIVIQNLEHKISEGICKHIRDPYQIATMNTVARFGGVETKSSNVRSAVLIERGSS